MWQAVESLVSTPRAVRAVIRSSQLARRSLHTYLYFGTKNTQRVEEEEEGGGGNRTKPSPALVEGQAEEEEARARSAS